MDIKNHNNYSTIPISVLSVLWVSTYFMNYFIHVKAIIPILYSHIFYHIFTIIFGEGHIDFAENFIMAIFSTCEYAPGFV